MTKWTVMAELNVGVLPWTWLGTFDTEQEARDRSTVAMKADFSWEYEGEFGREIAIGRAMRVVITETEDEE